MKKHLRLFLICLLCLPVSTRAVPAYPGLIQYRQADGSILEIYLKGDECLSWGETSDGFSILLNNGFYEYARLDKNQNMITSGIRVNNAANRSEQEHKYLDKTPKHLVSQGSILTNSKYSSAIKNQNSPSTKAASTIGDRKLLCILMSFKDLDFIKTNNDFNNLFNQENFSMDGTSGSVRDYFLESSYEQLNLQTTIVGPFKASNNMAYYGANKNGEGGNDINPGALVQEAVAFADPLIDFSDYDHNGDGIVDDIYIIYAGYAESSGGSADCIWPHAFAISYTEVDGVKVFKYACSSELGGNSGNEIAPIGTICHEYGHTLGAPDFYDTDYSSNGLYDGTGNWDLHGEGCWNNDGKTPAHPNAYTKCFIYQWANPQILSHASSLQIANAGQNKNAYYYYYYASSSEDEIYLLENRQKTGFDAALPGSGLVVYHADKKAIKQGVRINSGSHQGLYIKAANSPSESGVNLSSMSTINTQACPFPGSKNKTFFSDNSIPNAKAWNGKPTNFALSDIYEDTLRKQIYFDFKGGNPECASVNTPASNLKATDSSGRSLTLQWKRGSGDSVLVIAKTLSNLCLFAPEKGTFFQADSIFGKGDSIEPNAFVVYKGTDTSVTISGLAYATPYYFTVYEFSANGCYNRKPPRLSFSTKSSPYCVSTGSPKFPICITNVQYNQLNHASKKSVYSNFMYLSTPVLKGNTYDLSVRVNTSGNLKVYAKAWIDWNQNGEFENTESYPLGFIENSDSLTSLSPLSISIPRDALEGKTVMRISCKYSLEPKVCETAMAGEVEEYTIEVLPACDTFSITPIASTNGYILPKEVQKLACNENTHFKFYPDSGYAIHLIKVNGIIVDSLNNQYTFENITEDKEIEVSFRKLPEIVIVKDYFEYGSVISEPLQACSPLITPDPSLWDISKSIGKLEGEPATFFADNPDLEKYEFVGYKVYGNGMNIPIDTFKTAWNENGFNFYRNAQHDYDSIHLVFIFKAVDVIPPPPPSEDSTSINADQTKKMATIYSDHNLISINNLSMPALLSISDLNGRIILQKQLCGGEYNLSFELKGIFILQLRSKDRQFTQKILMK